MSSNGKITFREDFSYEWKIDNFLEEPMANDQPFQSPFLSVIDNNGRIGEICLQISPKRDSKTSLYISPKRDSETSKHVFLSFINVSKEELEFKFRWGPYLNF